MSQRQRNVLLIGGSGFVSGALARACLAAGHKTWAVTRGNLPLPDGVIGLQADRHEPQAFSRTIERAGQHWDLAVDCIAYDPADVRQDVAVLGGRAGQFVLIPTDFVYDPTERTFPQRLDRPCILDDSYGGKKRRCELELLNAPAAAMKWTIIRPCHIYGPGSLLGCLPAHGRDPELLDHLRAGRPLRLVGGGHFLQQPLFAADLARLILSVMDNEQAIGKIYPAAGPDIIESRRYYRIIADQLAVDLRVEELRVCDYRREHPDRAPFLCHRVYDLSALADPQETLDKAEMGQGLAQKLERSRKPVIAAVNGRYCLGGGTEFAMACHMRIAEESVRFAQPEIKLGLIPGWGGTQRLVRLVGLGRAIELILTGDHIRAQEAYRIGLVNKVVPAGSAVSEAVRLAKRIASMSSVAIANALDAIYAGLDMDLDEGLAYEAKRFSEMANTHDMGEGLRAFVEKRRPHFEDR